MVIQLNHTYSEDLARDQMKLEEIINFSLNSPELAIIFFPVKHPLSRSMFWPKGLNKSYLSTLPPLISSSLFGVPTIIIKNQPRWEQVALSFIHEYRHYWQHQALSPEQINASNRHKWIAECRLCKMPKTDLPIPLEMDAEIYAYQKMQLFLESPNSKRMVDILYGINFDDVFFKNNLDKCPIWNRQQLNQKISEHSKLVEKSWHNHTTPIHNSALA